MRLVYLGSGRSIHTVRWVRGLARRGHEVHLVTQQPLREPVPECASVSLLPIAGPLGYLLNWWALRRLVRRVRPDVLHVNYATGYGTLARLAAVRVPTVLTVWGSDVHEFPERGPLFRALVARNLGAAAVVTSASEAMARAVRALRPGVRVVVVPFGVDTGTFRPPSTPVAPGAERVVGTVKGLAPVYGIDLLLRAFAAARGPSDSAAPPRLVIAGEGAGRPELEALARTLGIADAVTFVGDVSHARVPALLGSFTVFVALSRCESFGVAVVEASACGVPVVVTAVGGLPEVVQPGVTGEIVPPEDVAAAARAIRALLDDPVRAVAMGRAGRAFVQRHFEWDACVDRMVAVFEEVAGAAAAGGALPGTGVTGAARRISIDP